MLQTHLLTHNVMFSLFDPISVDRFGRSFTGLWSLWTLCFINIDPNHFLGYLSQLFVFVNIEDENFVVHSLWYIIISVIIIFYTGKKTHNR